MSKALRCDRCGKCFDPYEAKGSFAKIRDFILSNDAAFRNDEVIYRAEELDFCPPCTNELLTMITREGHKI